MADVRELHKLLMELDDQLVTCMRCGMCQAVCPLYAETGREALVARGKIALLEHLAHEMIKDAAGVQEKVATCLLCGACAANCPSGVKVLDIFLKARAVLTGYMGLPPAKKLIFRGLLVRPGLFNTILGLGAKLQGLFVKPVNEMLGSSCARFQSDVIGDRHFPALAGEPLHKLVPSLDTAKGNSGLKVGFFPGCMVDKVFPRVGKAVLKVLEHHGVGVFLPGHQACCGIPALSSGDRKSYDVLVDKNLECFAGGSFDYLVTPCATCTSTIKKFWPTFADSADQGRREALVALAAKTLDINEFLVDILKVQPSGVPGAKDMKVTVHDPCHLKKSLGVAAQPRQVVRLNPNVELVEMKDADTCCGCGGSFTLLHYDLARRIGKKKRDNIAASGAQVVATGCPACMLQITDMLSKAGDRVAVRHPVELYAETLG
ncbi:(Fe-S)-binding protein [Desulfovibrio sp.]